MTEGSNFSLADIGAMMRNGDGFNNNSWWIIILFFWFMWGRNDRDGVTSTEMNARFDTNSVLNKLNGIEDSICNGFANQNTNILQTSNQIQRDIISGFNNLGSEVANNRFANQQCCCETNRNIDAVRTEKYKNTCEIVRAVESQGEQTRALITANQMQELRDKIAEKDQQLQTANFQLSQQAQSANIINTLQPVSKPAYITCSPYESAYIGSRGFGCNNYYNY